MRAVGIKELKNKLSEYVRIAASGEPVLVTDRGRVVAELVQPKTGRAEATPDERWAEAVRQGLITPAVDRSGIPLPKLKPLMTRAALLKELARDREDR